jgi:dTMP kinase
MTSERGLFIAVEGIEGSGKSTLATSIAESLTKSGMSALLTKEPGGTELGVQLRKILLESDTKLSFQTETLLFLADRAHHISSLIVPSLESGLNVICDRYFFSTLAYQGYGRGQDLEVLRKLVSFAHGELIPDLVLIVDLPVDVALKRAEARRSKDSSSWNRFEEEQITFHKKVKEGFLDLAKRYPTISVILNGELEKAALLESALGIIHSRKGR